MRRKLFDSPNTAAPFEGRPSNPGVQPSPAPAEPMEDGMETNVLSQELENSPPGIARKVSEVSEVDFGQEEAAESMDKRLEPGRDDEIAGHEGGPTLYHHLLPRNKHGHDVDSEEDVTPTPHKIKRRRLDSEESTQTGQMEIEEEILINEGDQSYTEDLPDFSHSPAPLDSPVFVPENPVDGKYFLFPNITSRQCFATTGLHCLLLNKDFRDTIRQNVNVIPSSLLTHLKTAITNPEKGLSAMLTDLKFPDEQGDTADFLQRVLERLKKDIGYNPCETQRMVDTICLNQRCQKSRSYTEINQIINIPLREDESVDLQAELDKLLAGTTYSICDTIQCKRSKQAHQIGGMWLGTPPDPYFIIKLNRVDEDFRKINKPIQIQKRINFCSKQYKLSSFVLHHGDEVDSGHYTAYSFRSDGGVNHYNDMGLNSVPELNTGITNVDKYLPFASVLFFTCETETQSVPLQASPVRNPAKQVFSAPASPLFSPLFSPSQGKNNSPKGRIAKKFRDQQEQEEDQLKRIHFFSGTIQDVIFVGKKGEIWGTKDDLLNFFVVIPTSTIVMFRVAHESVGELTVECLLEYLLTPTGLPFNVPSFKNTIYYKDEMLNLDVDILNFSADGKKKGNVTFILEQKNIEMNHSGLLWTCETCEGETSLTDNNKKLLMGNTRHGRFITKHKKHELKFSQLLEGRTKWGTPQDKYTKPYGCPADHKSVPKTKVDPKVPEVSLPDLPAVTIQPAAGTTTRSGRHVKPIEQVESSVEADEDFDMEINEEQEKVKAPRTIRPTVRNFDPSEETVSNRETRRTIMQKRRETPLELGFILNEDDKQFLKVHVIKPCLTEKNKKHPMGKAGMKKASIDQINKGELPTDPNDKLWCSRTHEAYSTGAKLIMKMIQKERGQEIHFADFLAFGTERYIRPTNYLSQIKEEITTSQQAHALGAYFLILRAVASVADKNPMAFKPLIENADDLDHVILRKRCEDEADKVRTRVFNVQSEMKGEKPYSEFSNAARAQTMMKKQEREVLEGETLPDPSVVIPAYFRNSDVQEIETELLETAQNAHKKIPSKAQMNKFTNFLAVRLMIKNPGRKEVLGNMTRKEYLAGRDDKIKEYPYIPSDGSAQQQNVLNFGEGIGCHRLVLEDADENTYPDEQQGIIIKTAQHKGGHSSPAITFLSLVDTMLMDAYFTISREYVKEYAKLKPDLEFEFDHPLLINSSCNKYLSHNSNVDWTLFCEIADIPDMRAHISRHMFVGYMCNLNSVAAQEHAAFTACHSEAIQQSTYLSSRARKLKQVAGAALYSRKVTKEHGLPAQRYKISDEATLAFAADTIEIQRQQWERYLEIRKEQDLRQEPSAKQVITPNVSVNLFDLIWTVGLQGELDKRLIKEGAARGKTILEKLLCGFPVMNNDTKSLIMTMIDFAPELECSKVLLENLYWYCQLESQDDLDKIEVQWTTKLAQIIDNYKGKGKNMKNPRLKELFCQPNLEHNYKYCFGNQLIQKTLQHYNRHQAKRVERINTMHDPSTAVPATDALSLINQQIERRREDSEEAMDSDGAASTLSSNSRVHAKKRKIAAISGSQQGGEMEKSDVSSDVNQDFFDNVEDAAYDDGDFSVKKVAEVEGTPSKTVHIHTDSGTHFTINEGLTVFSHESPVRLNRKRSSNPTPNYGDKKAYGLKSDDEKLELAKLYIEFATDIAPFNKVKGSKNPVKADMKTIWSKYSIGGSTLKERYRNSNNLADIIQGKPNQKLGFSLQQKGEGLKTIIDECMLENYPNDDWTVEMMQGIRAGILRRMKDFMKGKTSEKDQTSDEDED